MPSQIIKILVAEGDKVSKDQALIVLTSMKMENTITANEEGIVQTVNVIEGQNVAAGVVLVHID